MGQATIDLPDPLDLPPVDHNSGLPISAAALASADDLLSQLAGDDIDRLLAEAESADLPAAAEPTITEPIADAASADHAELLRVAEQTVADVAGDDAESATTVVSNTPQFEISHQLSLDEATALQVMIEPAPLAIEPVAVDVAADIAIQQTIADVGHVEIPSSDIVSVDVATEVAAPHERHALVEAPPAGPPSLLVRGLQLINSPLAWLPDSLRDALGKVGLLTMFNAIAVLGYVLLFRGKHPH